MAGPGPRLGRRSEREDANLDRLRGKALVSPGGLDRARLLPGRACLMTGQRALTHGVFLNDVPLSPDAATLAKVCGRGYDTGYIGKWHLDGHGRSNFIPRERRQGFDYWKALECTHDYNHSFYYADGPRSYWEGYDAIAQTRDAKRYLRDPARPPAVLALPAWGPPHDPYRTAPQKYRTM